MENIEKSEINKVINNILKELKELKRICDNNDNFESFMWRKAQGVEDSIEIVKKFLQ